ncbi:MAG: thiosulfate oxidation carrier complex protein SoxZ [Fimbriimonadaceae bacterium]|nr:thiosulfate oxidation carrier complex protein SoxZ [Fimbriimonadaceae bacterium]
MTGSIKLQARLQAGSNIAALKALIQHPMETGFTKDRKTGEVIPEDYITTVTIKLNGTVVATQEWGAGVSKNPYLALQLKGCKAGDKIELAWADLKGDSDSAAVTVA